MNAKAIKNERQSNKKIKRLIHDNLDKYISNQFDADIILNEIDESEIYSILNFGRQNDADAIVFLKNTGIDINILLISGKSICLGTGIKSYFFAYHNGVLEDTENHIKWIVDNACDGLKNQSNCILIIRRDYPEIWRSFRGNNLMTLNEILAKKTISLH